MTTVVKIGNKICGGNNAQKHRMFIAFLQELDTHYCDLLMFSEVRWLSRGKCLQRFFELRKEVIIFLAEEIKDSSSLLEQIKTEAFNINLAFLTDITTHLNPLN